MGEQALQRRRVGTLFEELCRIPSVSRSERALADRVSAELRSLGLEVTEDDAGTRIGGDAGNLLTRIPAARDGAPTVLLCAHMDTVPLAAPLEPELRDGVWENAGEGILGADNKAAVAMLLVLARHLHAEGSPVELELLFTVGEEISLAGSRAFDASALRARFGYVFDHASPIGEVIVASPTHYRLQAEFLGCAAHAGLEPERGRSAIVAAARAITAMPPGRVDEQSTFNIGTVEGGGAINVVPDRCTIVGEARSLDAVRAGELAAVFVDACQAAANLPDVDVDVDVTAEVTFTGYRHDERNAAVRAALAALERCGHDARTVASGGGSDANNLILQGIDVVNVANGTEFAHRPDERVSARALDEMFDVALALLEAAAG
ncbi:MAG TPA: M20/M25/M40 family metallo-hydrolase [Solirubrobacteraceae bacterium]|nr:M20/M25/M40 family metallo-hydrolase [Solirubrobacteraceae bacterium]